MGQKTTQGTATPETDERTCQYCGKARDAEEGGILCTSFGEKVNGFDSGCDEWEPIEVEGGVNEGETNNNRPPETKMVQEYLRYNFTREELEDLATELARSLTEVNREKLHKKDVVKSLDSDISKLETKIAELAEKRNSGYEYRNIDCEVRYDYEVRMKTTVRLDTGEIIKTIPMTADELQQELEFGRG